VGPQKPEEQAREKIDAALEAAGWTVQDRVEMNVHVAQGVAIREFPLKTGHGVADYLLFVDSKAVGVIEAKKEGFPLAGVEFQVERYSLGLPDDLDPPVSPLPFLYLSTGAVTKITNLLDPRPRSRRIFHFHQPETLAEWNAADTLAKHTAEWSPALKAAEGPPTGGGYGAKPSTLRSRIKVMPELSREGLWDNQFRAVRNLEKSLREDRPRSLVQMATGSGKSRFAVASIYRLVKYAGARRVLFLVDRDNLGKQAKTEFEGFRTPDDHRKLDDELYKVQRLTSNSILDSSKVVISTIQRMYSLLRGDPEYDTDLEQESQFLAGEDAVKEPLPAVYNADIPPEFFDVIIVDECHRSIYSLWRQVLEYFDAYLIGLTATPAKHTFGFFNGNLVMEYPHERAVADRVNVDFEVYRIRTRITEEGSTIEASDLPIVGYRDRATRKLRWEAPDEDVTYGGKDLDRNVVSKGQIRLIVQTLRDRMFTEIFPGRREVPKTLIFAKDDSHAEDIVEIVREEFARGNKFARKITYKVTGEKPEDLIQKFRTGYSPRVAVTVDMIATGTDIKPVEIVVFMRSVRSRVLFEQMKGRGVRVINPNDLRAVTPDAGTKDHFVIVDCVGVTETEMADTQPLERKKGVSLKALLDHVALGGTDPDVASSLASRLARLDKRFGPDEREKIREASGGQNLSDLAAGIVEALDPDMHVELARQQNELPEGVEPTEDQVKATAKGAILEAVKPVAAIRSRLLEVKAAFEQVIDEVNVDELLEAGASPAAADKARVMVESFEKYLEDNRDEIDALQFFYSVPHAERLRYEDIKALSRAIHEPPRSWTPEVLWRAYETLDRDRVRGASAQRLLTDVVSLVRYALHQDDELVPYAEVVKERFAAWMAQQEQRGRTFTGDQVQWLEMMRDHVATSLEIDLEDFDFDPFAQQGGLGRARKVFGADLGAILREMNEVLVA